MSGKTSKTLSLAIGAAFVASLATSSIVSAAENPFEMTKLSNGYETVAKEGKCGEGKCGEGKKKDSKCDESKKKDGKKKEGKCGEGKCGGKK